MKNNIIIQIGKMVLPAIALCATVSCSDDFLAEKRPFGSFGPEQVYGDWNSVKLRLNYIYQRSLPNAHNGSGQHSREPDLWPVGFPDLLSKCTEEFPGYGDYTDPANVWDNTNINKWFYYGVNESPWKKMRECTDVIVRTNESNSLDQLQKHWVEGQGRFFRATRYFRLFKRFGGLPIIKGLQSTLSSDIDSLSISRNSTKETFDFIIEDLTVAGEYLPVRWEEEVNDWGRITSGAAYALAGYVANYYASPVFNRADDVARWQQAYELNKLALEKLDEGHFGLSYAGSPGKNASNWAKIWCNMMGGDPLSSEAVYLKICNNVNDENPIHNAWEQSIRPSNAAGGGGIEPSAEMVDAFPMADGKRPTEVGTYTYDKKLFFLNRDPRFYRTFAFPGTEWRYNGSVSEEMADQCPYMSGQDYKLMNFAWYPTLEEATDTLKTGYYTDLLGNDGQSIYVRKKSQDYALGESALYLFDEENGFNLNGQPLIAMRYTEVLLNFAEAACGANKLDEAYEALISIRQRVGYKGDCGLDPIIKTDRAKMFEAILYERKIELAYEGKRFDDCHRWMLFDGGTGQETIEPTWTLTAWSGNTCKYLGVAPLKDVVRHTIELYIDPAVHMANKEAVNDPFTTGVLEKPKALTLNEDMTATMETVNDETVITYADPNVQALAEFYVRNLVRKDVSTMTSEAETGIFPVWDPKLYLMGLQSGDQQNNPGVVQTIGWNSRFGGMGIFDPLSDNPKTSIDDEESSSATTEDEVVEGETTETI